MTPEEWENLCDRCGGCCDIGNGVACAKLDTTTNLCTTYEDRSAIKSCVNVRPDNVKFLHEKGSLPDSCAYVRWTQGLEPEPGVYRLIPFIMSKPELQRKFWELQKTVWTPTISFEQEIKL